MSVMANQKNEQNGVKSTNVALFSFVQEIANVNAKDHARRLMQVGRSDVANLLETVFRKNLFCFRLPSGS